LGGLKDLSGAGESLSQILEDSSTLPPTDPEVTSLKSTLSSVLSRLEGVTSATTRLNETAKVNRSLESKRVKGGRSTFGAGPAIALLHLRRQQVNSQGQRS
jgi:hypothetical protein